MSITKKEIESIQSKPLKVPAIINFIFSVLSPLSKIPAIRKYIENSSGGLNGQIFRHWNKQEYDEATKVAIKGLEKYRNKKSLLTPFMDHHTWWQFMQSGVDSAKNSDNLELKDKLIEYWTKNGISDLEGVYEVVGGNIQYELAVINQNGDYTIIYLAGANGSAWKVGDIKATLKKSASFGVFKAKWAMLNKSQNKDVLITFKNSSFSAPSETDDSSVSYIKTFPTYESKIKKKE